MLLSLIAATGCQSIPSTMLSTPSAQSQIIGVVHGGQQPLSASTVQLMAVGTSGDGSAAISLMTSAVQTDASGYFSLTGKYQCPSSSTQVYLLATGGNPGLSAGTNNESVALMTALGNCGSLNANTYISINELTTVGSIAALLPYATGALNIGSSSSDASSLSAAMSIVTEYVNTVTGSAPGPSLPNGYTASTLALTSLGNILGGCINSPGGIVGDDSSCGKLYNYTTYGGGAVPTDTVTALVNILSNPSNNAVALFDLISPTPPFSGGLSSAPSNWALPIALDSSGTVQLATQTYNVQESDPSVSLSVSRNLSADAVTVDYHTVNGTASAGTDYQATSGTLSWTSGDASSKLITVPFYNSGRSSGDVNFSVVLNSPTGATLGNIAVSQVSIAATDAPLTISTTSLSDGTQYATYSTQLNSSGGVGAVTWSLASGTLPVGMSLSSLGVLSGIPSTYGSFPVTVQLSDSATPSSQQIQKALTLNITSLADDVAALPSSTPADAIKKAVLNWGITGASSLASNGNSIDSYNLYTDVANELTTTFTVPTALPSTYYPNIPSISTNPMVIAANKAIGTQLTNDSKTAPTWDDPSYTGITAGSNLRMAENMIYALLTPGQSYYLNAALIPSVLSRLESASYLISTSDPADFASASELPYLYLMISQAWPQLMLPSRQKIWKNIIAANTALEVSNNGAHFSNSSSQVVSWWINADVGNLTAIVYGDLVGETTSQHTAIIQGALYEMSHALMPDGGTNYTDNQNETWSYHNTYPYELARYTQVTGDTTGTTLAAGTRYYTPLSMVPPAIGEYVTAVSWKKYWNQSLNQDAMAIVVGLTGDQTSAWQLGSVGYPASYVDAQYYRADVTPTALPENWITYDRNAQGPRGIQGNFAYMSTTRTTPLSQRGKATYVGEVVVNSTAKGAGWTLNAALESAGTIALTATGGELASGEFPNMVSLAQNEHNASTTTSTFGAVSTTHTLSAYQKASTSWTETQAWVLLPTRIIGLVTVQNTSTEKDFELDGAFRFVSGREYWGTQKTFTQLSSNLWTYGSLTAQVYATDYPGSRTELANTWEDTAQKAGWILLTDAHNSTTSSYSFPPGTSHYYVAEVRPSTGSAATSVQQISLSSGLIGFTFADGGITYIMIQNTTASSIAYSVPNGTVTMSGAQYRATWIDPNGTTSIVGATYTGSIPAYSHIVVTQ